MSQIDAKNVVVLCSSPKSMFVGDEGTKQSDADILRCLNSSRQLQQMKIIIPLEEGNIVNGLPAAGVYKRSRQNITAITSSRGFLTACRVIDLVFISSTLFM